MAEHDEKEEGWAEADVANAGAELAEAAVQPVAFGQLGPGTMADENKNLDLLLDVEIPISVEVGGTEMSLEDVLKLVPGSVIALDKKSEDPGRAPRQRQARSPWRGGARRRRLRPANHAGRRCGGQNRKSAVRSQALSCLSVVQ